MQDLQGDDDAGREGGRQRRWSWVQGGGEKWGDEERGGTQQPNESRRTERGVQPESVLAVLFCNCMPLTAAPAINTMRERERESELLVRDHLLTEIIFSLALG